MEQHNQRNSESCFLAFASSTLLSKSAVFMDQWDGILATSLMKLTWEFQLNNLLSLLMTTQTRHHLMPLSTLQASATMVVV